MKVVFIYGQAGVGKLTVARALTELSGLALFHNHLVVDAVASVFPFGSEAFARIRERWWLEMFAEAAAADRSLIFTFAPEPTVAPDFPERVRSLIGANGGETHFIRLTVPAEEQERRIDALRRSEFGKMQSVDLLRSLRPQFDAAMEAMPQPLLTIDTGQVKPNAAAENIMHAIWPLS